MPRVTALAVVVVFLVVAFCCPPPALALEKKAEVMVCPITGEVCQTEQADCDPPPPQLSASVDAPIKVITPSAATLPPTPRICAPSPSHPPSLTHWTEPTRTIVLRI